MLARAYRLPATTKLTRAHFAKTELFGVKYIENNLSINRFGFVVRKSVDNRAVVRNRIRRVFRSCVEELQKESVLGYDMLFFLEKGIMEIKREDLCVRLKNFFVKSNLITGVANAKNKTQKSKI